MTAAHEFDWDGSGQHGWLGCGGIIVLVAVALLVVEVVLITAGVR